ncbi:hypothetical protein AX16_000255 [Volvariella volvacea WC 439]|nr:hypothetical protein AX16_000255 [Volvariella volvacea WC 439]
MCYIYGSVDQAVNACPMCKVFPHSRCPHVREICRNRTAHPRCDVLYLKNAEVECFNGCGYCKWARIKPPTTLAGWNNPGWPGCCRPPASSEYRLIQIADWKSVSIIHHVPIPPEISAALGSLQRGGSSPIPPRPAPGHSRPSGSSHERRGSTTTPPTKPISSSGKNTVRGRSSGSPQLPYQITGANLSRSSSVTTISSSVSNAEYRRHEHIDKSRSSRSSPSRKHTDVDPSKRPGSSHGRRPSVTPATTSVSVSNVNAAADSRATAGPSAPRHKSSLSSSSVPTAKLPTSPRPGDRPSFTVPRTPKKDDDDSSSASSSSGSEGGLSDSTVTSDGAFTDYLSEESEAELQRQAEAKAALVAQNQAEEMEFKAARQQLAHIDLRPPKAWNSTNLQYNSSAAVPAGSAPYSPNIPISNTARS